MTPLTKIVTCYIGALVLFGLLVAGLANGRILLVFTSIVLTLPCLRFIMLERGEEELILTRWPSAGIPSLIFGLLFMIPALIGGIWAIWNTAIPQAFIALMSLGFGLNFVLVWLTSIEVKQEQSATQQ